jgi:tetratricopeptide (TPR) repeat protein
MPTSIAHGEDRSRKDFWVGRYGEIREGPLAVRCREVFTRVLASADKRAGVEPSFHVIAYGGGPWAQTLSDGSILLTLNAVEFCYRNQPPEKGDARLAFVIGHELAHHFNGDFWEYRFLRSAKNEKGGKREFQDVRTVAKTPEVQLVRELQADQYGVVYASLAGYDSDIVISEDKSFFRQWAEKTLPEKGIRKELATTLDQREKAVYLRLKEISEKVSLFKLGVVSARVGRPDDALLLFRRFAADFPGREVYGNIGAVLLGRAYDRFLASRAPESFPFVLSFGVESSTRAELIDVGRRFSEEKYRDFKRNLGEAVENLEKSIGYDPFYAGARNSLGCARILEKKYYDAVSALEQAQKLSPGNARIEGNLAVASILLGQELGSEALFVRAESILKPLSSRNDAARTNWAAYRRSRGKQVDGEGAPGFIVEDPRLTIQPPHVYRKEFQPGKKLPANHSMTVVDETVEGGVTTRVYTDATRKVVLLVRNGSIRLVMYREPPRLPPGAVAGGMGDVFVSRQGKNGCFLSDQRPMSYFEF